MRHPLSDRAMLQRTMGWALLAVLLAAVGVPAATAHGAAAAAGQQAAARPHLVTITMHDFFYAMPSTIPSGLTEFIIVNQGRQNHMAQLFRLKSGVTEAQVIKAAQAPKITSLLAVASAVGGAESVRPGQQQHAILNLSAGRYEALCFETGPDNTPHFLKGMHKLFHVVAGASARTDTDNRLLASGLPASDGTIVLRDFHITLPAAIHTRGMHTFHVLNDGPQTHEVGFMRLNAGKTLNDFVNALKANKEPPVTDAGGSGAFAPHGNGWIETDLAPGNYVAACFVPDVKTGKPHAVMGMETAFTVR
jgi:hypothetical protein